MEAKLTRRGFLVLTTAAGVGVLVGCTTKPGESSAPSGTASPGSAAGSGVSPQLEQFVDALPLPGVMAPEAGSGAPLYEMAGMEFAQQLHRDLDPTRVYGFNGSYPGPTIEARSGKPIQVKWVNRLPEEHFLPIDTTLHGAEANQPGGRMVVHLHGAHVPMDSDGYPENWIVPGESVVYDYPNNQIAAPLWYHDHVMGITRLNVYAGLVGLYLIRDDEEDALGLPSGDYEVPLALQDKIFNEDGSMYYPPVNPDRPGHMWVPEFFGDTILVNGKVWPYLDVEPRKYRFRLYGGANARFFRLKLSNGAPFVVIGTEGGLLPEPAEMDEIVLGPGERADVIVDFTGMADERIELTNDAPTPFPDGDPVDPETVGKVMCFKVTKALSDSPDAAIPRSLRPVKRIPESKADVTRDFTFFEIVDGDDNPKTVQINKMDFDDPIVDKPMLGDTEVWNLINPTVDAHPIHLHLVHFQVLDRRPFDVKAWENTGKVIFTGEARPPEPHESAWKDTVVAYPGEVTRIIQTFEDYAGKYPWHCHILEHEDNAMMLQFETVERGGR